LASRVTPLFLPRTEVVTPLTSELATGRGCPRRPRGEAHIAYVPDPLRRHNGTLELTCTDAHDVSRALAAINVDDVGAVLK